MSDEKPEKSNKLETLCGLLLAVFAASLAIADLGGGRVSEDGMVAMNEKASALNWYQSKSIKQSLIEGEKDLLITLVATGSIE
jgi:hypothetical protein